MPECRCSTLQYEKNCAQNAFASSMLPGHWPGRAPGRVDRLECVSAFLGQGACGGADGQAGLAPGLDLHRFPAEGALVLHPD
jgi:hypothetical protein